MKHTLLLVLAALTGPAVFVACDDAPVAPADDIQASERVVLSQQTSEGTNLVMMDANGSNRQQLTTDGGSYLYPTLSPDGRRIAYQSYSGIHVMDIDGGNQRRITPDGVTPDWSPDGRSIIYTSSQEGSSEIMKVDVSSNRVERLSSNTHRDYSPKYSPDGRTIAFISDRSGGRRIWMMNADGSEPHMISSPDEEFDAAFDAGNPFSPDGSRLLYSSNGNVHIVNADGTGQLALTDVSNSTTGIASWSPDGSRIAFFVGGEGNAELHVTDPDGRRPTVVASNVHDVFTAPVWSGDMNHLLYVDGYRTYIHRNGGSRLALSYYGYMALHPIFVP